MTPPLPSLSGMKDEEEEDEGDGSVMGFGISHLMALTH